MFDFAIVLNPEIRDIILLTIKQRLAALDFTVGELKNKKEIIILIRHTNAKVILETLAALKLEKIKYSKQDYKTELKSSTQDASRGRKLQKYQQFKESQSILDPRIPQMERFSKFKYVDRHKFVEGIKTTLADELLLEEIFQPWEREMAIYQILANIQVDEQFRLLFEDNEVGKQDYLFVYLKKKEILRDFCPLPQHQVQRKQAFGYKYLDSMVESTYRNYGEQVAIYFYFLLYLIKQMGFLVVAGIITFILDEVFDEDVNTSPFETVYAMITIIWGSYFIGKWKRRQKEIRVLWRSKGKNYEFYERSLNQSLIKCLSHDDHELFDHEQQLTLERNLQFTQQHLSDHNCDIDEVTGLKTPKKLHNIYLLYIKSAFKSFPYLLATSIFLILSLNIRGYILPQHTWIYFPRLASLSEDGAIFDKNSQKANITTAIHVLVVFFLNEKYKEVSIETSLLEKHESFDAFQASLIVKRFAFEMLSGFMDFFYIGFIRFDILALKSELLSMFTFDEIRRLIFETVIPQFQKSSLDRQVQHQLLSIDNNTLQMSRSFLKVPSQGWQLLHKQVLSVQLPKYESFDDYLEIILNFGYLAFFTSAYPLAGIVIAFFFVVEFLSDHYKIQSLYQKPFSMKAKGIGPWVGTMNMICILSVFSNLILFAFASDKIAEVFPSLFLETAHHHLQEKPADHLVLMATPKAGAGRYIAIIVFVIEHLLFLGMWLTRQYLKNLNHWTQTYLARAAYKKTIKMK